MRQLYYNNLSNQTRWEALMVSALPLDESQISRAAENMIREHGDEALTKADDRVEKSKSEGFDWFARTWELIREVIKDEQESDNKRGEPS